MSIRQGPTSVDRMIKTLRGARLTEVQRAALAEIASTSTDVASILDGKTPDIDAHRKAGRTKTARHGGAHPMKKILRGENMAEQSISYHDAREIMGHDSFYGPQEIKKIFGFFVPEAPIVIEGKTATRESLQLAKRQGYELMYFHDKDGRGNPLTMKYLNEIITLCPKTGKPRKLSSWVAKWKNEKFFKTDVPRSGWHLVSKKFIPDSLDENYFQQTKLLRDKLQAEGALTKSERAGCTDEILSSLKRSLDLLNIWQGVSRSLVNMKINKVHRCSPVEIVYGQFLRTKMRGRRDLNRNEWSNVRDKGGRLVFVRPAYPDGVGIGSQIPNSSDVENSGVGSTVFR